MTSNRTETAAQLIRHARVAERLSDLPDDLIPTTEAEAYAIQDAGLAPSDIAGWKVAPASAAKGHQCAPIPTAAVIQDGGSIPADARAPEVEGELAFVIGKTVPAEAGRSEVIDAVAGVCLAIEVLDSCFLDRKRANPLSAVADRQSNAGLVVGPLRTEWQSLDLALVSPRFSTPAGDEFLPSRPMPDTETVLDALVWLAGHAAARGRPLRDGQVVITGARVGPVPMERGTTFALAADGFASVAVRRD